MRSCLIAASLFLVLAEAPVPADESKLWGREGELWSPTSRLPDFAFAGYHFGEAEPPTNPVEVSVKDFGALGDGKTDDTDAFKRAMAEASGKVILVPHGTYVLSDRIEISGRGTVLRGESRDGSVLLFTKGLEDLYPAPTTNDGGLATSNWSWTGGLLSIVSQSLHSGPRVKVAGTAERGDFKLTLEDANSFKVGDFVNLLAVNDSEGSLVKYLYRGDTGDVSGLTGNRNTSQVNKIVAIEGNVVELVRPLRIAVKAEFGCTVTKVDPRTTECGIEQLTLRFESGIYRAHFTERGFNGITISSSAIHCWVRQVKMIDADSGIFGAGTHGLIDGVVFESKRKSLTPDNIKGHHGVDGGVDCLIQNVTFESPFFHDLSVSGGNVGNVFRRVRGKDVNMDQHRWGPYENLFTDIDLGEGNRPWLSGGGRNRGKHTAAGTTFWNLRSKRVVEMPYEEFGPPTLQFVGIRVRGNATKEDAWWVESIASAKLVPHDLYQAQLERRLKAGIRMFPSTEATMPLAKHDAGAVSQSWTSVEGRVIQAKFGGLQGESVKLITEAGQEYLVPLTKLDEASQQQARSLAGVAQ
jgi:hypothetical protein